MAMLEGRMRLRGLTEGEGRRHRPSESIHNLLEVHAASGDKERFFEANQEFHRAVQELADNRWLQQVIQDLRKVLKLTACTRCRPRAACSSRWPSTG